MNLKRNCIQEQKTMVRRNWKSPSLQLEIILTINEAGPCFASSRQGPACRNPTGASVWPSTKLGWYKLNGHWTSVFTKCDINFYDNASHSSTLPDCMMRPYQAPQTVICFVNNYPDGSWEQLVPAITLCLNFYNSLFVGIIFFPHVICGLEY